MIKLNTKRTWKGDKNKKKQGLDKVRSWRTSLVRKTRRTSGSTGMMTVTKQGQENERKNTERRTILYELQQDKVCMENFALH
jgi:hypothetical protein